ncbi:Lon protease family protein [Anaerotignum sp. MB30-C6]|uniref:Lon protease family protein n=1 Tax=Anaerotignum sp. MB30-C6 TaxID=3070814 RepID=UPI0027DD71C8|nr:ATP-binding protein [Anaerotignum sp. MB30-C6]WMI80798.1 ATP-binding protein [Anaerotignum sp. MB30-C6]
MAQELKYSQLKNGCFPEDFSFNTTGEISPLEGIIGQERAVRAFDFGLMVKMKGYNIYVAGPSGTGKTTYARSSTEKLAAKEPIPRDWCYVYNFQNPRNPLALRFEKGMGRQFKEDMNELVQLLKTEIQKVFRAEDYEKQKNELLRSFDEKRSSLMEDMSKMAAEYEFQVKTTNSGIYFMPIVNGSAIGEEEYDNLPEDVKNVIEKNSQVVQEKAGAIMRDIRELDKASKKQLEQLDYKVGMFAIGHHIIQIQEKYQDYKRVIDYMNDLKEDVLENLSQFYEDDEEGEEGLSSLLPMLGKKPAEDVTLKYKVNLIVDHSKSEGAPVVVSFNPTYSNLIGEVEYDSEFGNLTTDFMKIKGGLLHKANGGYLIVQAQDVLSLPQAWEALRRVIKTKEINMDSSRDQLGATVAPTLKPEPIPADIKVIMIGSNYYYELLSEYDEEFDKFFKIKADFDYEMPRSNENMWKLASFIKRFVEQEETIDFDVSAVCAIVEQSSRMVERQNKLSTRFNQLAEILSEAVTWAKMEEAKIVTSAHISKTIYEKEQRLKLYEEKLGEMLDENVIMIATQGSVVGQINGLAVLDMGSYAFGNPSRITATTYVGKSGIINIEKEARMSGHTHDKGVQIISGFLGQTYAQEFPLSLSCRICFEQNYNGIDGDSASSTELYCILSSLSEVPIRQDLAVTGSVNQKGEIQAIGGVTHKIEGYYDLCKKRGLTGTQGVLIPVSNINDLVLKDEVVESVKNGEFHIYPISHIEEGIELLMGIPAGEKDSNGKYPEESIHGYVMRKLRKFHGFSQGKDED